MYGFLRFSSVTPKLLASTVVISVLAILALPFVGQPAPANAITSNTLNFQGRLLSSTGALVPDGSYNIEFKLYDAATIDGGESLVQGVCQTNPGPIADENCLWAETRSGGDTVTIKNGYFSVYLGSVTAFPTTIDWDQELWLGMNIGGIGAPSWDGEMTPRFKLTAVPYALRAGAVTDAAGNSYTGDDLVQVSPGSVQALNTALAAIRLNQTGAGSLLQLQGNGSDVFTVDKTGNTVLGAGITVGNSSATTAGTIRWNGSAFQGYNGSTWTSLGSSAVMPFVSKTKTVSETQNIVINPTATLQPDDELSFSIGANETWNYRFLLNITMNATPDIKFSVTAPVGATCVNGVSDFENAISVANLGCGVSSGNIAGLTATDVYEVSGSITNGANSGTVTLNWAQNTANAANTIVLAGSYVEASRSVGGSSADIAFIQDGNSFGGLAVLGTNDANGLSFETNGVERLQIQSGGDIQAKDDLIANRITTGVTGTTSGTGTNTTTLSLVADTFSVDDVVFIDNVGQDYYTRITVDPGTGSYTVSPAVTFENARTVTAYTIQNIGATTSDYTSQANRFFQGYFLGGVVIGAGSTTIGDGSIESTTTLNLQTNGNDINVGGGLIVSGVLSGDGSGLTSLNAANLTGTLAAVDGSSITTLNASNISSGTLADGRLSSNVTLLGNTFNGNNQLLQLGASAELPALNGFALTNLSSANLSGALPAISGASLTSLNGSNISSGTVADARLSSNVTLLGNAFNGASQLVQLDVSGNLPALNGSALTSLNATNISSGTIGDSYLSSNVIVNSGLQTLTGLKTFDAGLTITNGQNFTVGGQTYTDLKGTGLLNTGGVLNVSYGSGAGTAVQGNVSLTCPSGSGNLTGGGTSITLGTGGTCGAISTNNAVTFTTSVTSPLFTGSGAVSVSSGGAGDLTLTSASGITVLGNTTQRRAGGLTYELNNAAADTTLTITNTDGTYKANLSVEGSITGASFSGVGTSLTALNASNITSGTIGDSYLSSNVIVKSGLQTLTGLKTFDAGLTITAGQNLTVNGDVITNLKGSGLSLSGTNLIVDATSATGFIRNGGNTLAGGLMTIGTGDANGISFITGGTNKLSILSGGNVGINNSNPGNKFNVNTPTTAVATTEAVISSTAAGNKGLVIQGAAGQSALLFELQTSTGTQLSGFNSSGGLVLGLTTLSSTATVARAISLPDAAGTVCLSNTDACGFVRLASGTVQTDATANNTIDINKTNATGSLILLKKNGTAVFTVANTGALQIQDTSTAALDIMNVGGTSYFSVDTSTGTVRVGPTAADATGVLFVLDTKNTTGDPTGINGGSYYNSADGRTRCYENGFWSDCATTRILGETTLGGAGNTITVNLATSTEYMMCRVDIKGRSTNNGIYLRFNGDSGAASYGWNEYDIINTAVGDAQDNSDSEIQLTGTDTSNITASATLDITNFADTQKIVDWSYAGATAVGTNNRHYNGTGNWANTSNQITSVSFITSAGNFNAGSHAWCEGRDIR